MSEQTGRNEIYAITNDQPASQRDYYVTTEVGTNGIYDTLGSETSIEQARQKRKMKKRCKLVGLVLGICLVISLITVIIYLIVTYGELSISE